MRIHRLELSAFGPFAETVNVDMDAVGAAGLFLVQGPTGAGKTSLLDAMCFALYAGVPGHRPHGASLASHHAAPGSLPWVRVEFTARGQRLRVYRQPEFHRPKKRGTGTVKEQAKVTLEVWTGSGWSPKSARNDEVGEIITDLIGMGLEQFSRVVMLPQGDFAAFLRAKVEERRALLERLFDASAFTDIETWLAEQRREQTALVNELSVDIERDRARLSDVVAKVPFEVIDGDETLFEDSSESESDPASLSAGESISSVPLPDLPPLLIELAEQLAEIEAHTLTRFDAATSSFESANSGLESGRALVAQRSRGDAALAALAALDAQRDEHEALTARLHLARSAGTVSGHLATHDRALSALDSATSNADVAKASLDSFATTDDLDLAGLQASAAALSVLSRRGQEWSHDHEQAVAARSELEAMARAEVDAPEQVARQRRLVAERATALETAQKAVAELPGLRHRAEVADRIATVRRQVVADTAKLAEARERETSCREASVAAREALVALREARIAGLAGELAAGLTSDCACPVCGSLEHPAPASAEKSVSAETVANAQDSADRAAAAVAAATEQCQALEATIRARLEEAEDALAAGGWTTLTDAGADELSAHAQKLAAQARAERDRVAKAAALLDAAVTAYQNAVDDLEALEAATVERTAARAAIAERAEALSARTALTYGSLRDELHEHARTCPGRCGAGSLAELDARHQELPDIEAIAAEHARLVKAAEAHHAAAAALAAAQTAADEAHAAALDAAETAGFESLDAVRAALLTAAEQKQTAEMLTAWSTARITQAAVLDDPQVDAALNADLPDMDGLTLTATSAKEALLQARDHRSLAVAAAADFAELAQHLTVAIERLSPALSRLQQLVEISELVAGTSPSNLKRMRLSSFVLAARLERVVALANERLSVIGDGRYRLVHDDSLESHGRRSGLGLKINDLWTGRQRSTTTLSGGESFMASLALALGLAEAVREESGGFDLQTLFIDEGFGTLDEGSLEQVMSVLDSLREGGRAVGVVSHVSDLRTRITHQLVVDKSTHGSTVKVIGAGAAPAA